MLPSEKHVLSRWSTQLVAVYFKKTSVAELASIAHEDTCDMMNKFFIWVNRFEMIVNEIICRMETPQHSLTDVRDEVNALKWGENVIEKLQTHFSIAFRINFAEIWSNKARITSMFNLAKNKCNLMLLGIDTCPSSCRHQRQWSKALIRKLVGQQKTTCMSVSFLLHNLTKFTPTSSKLRLQSNHYLLTFVRAIEIFCEQFLESSDTWKYLISSSFFRECWQHM